MPTKECSVCELEADVRKVYEGLVRTKVPLRDIVEFAEWLAGKRENPKLKISKSAIDRHKNNGHFVAEQAQTVEVNPDDEIQSLREFVREMFATFQKATKGKVPSHKEMMDLLLADAKLADIEQRRRDELDLRALMSGASYKAPTNPEPRQPGMEEKGMGKDS